MESLEKLHLQASGGNDEYEHDMELASKSAQITKDIAIEFGRWVIANPELGNTSTMSRGTVEYYFEEFLKTKNG